MYINCNFNEDEFSLKSGNFKEALVVGVEKIEGKVTIRFWPLNKFGTIKKAE